MIRFLLVFVLLLATEAVAQMPPPGPPPLGPPPVAVDEPVILSVHRTFYSVLPDGQELWYVYGDVGTIPERPQVEISWISCDGTTQCEQASVYMMTAPGSGVWNWGVLIIEDRISFPLLQVQAVRLDTDPWLWGPVYLYSDP